MVSAHWVLSFITLGLPLLPKLGGIKIQSLRWKEGLGPKAGKAVFKEDLNLACKYLSMIPEARQSKQENGVQGCLGYIVRDQPACVITVRP